jgi:hypothetical protein
MIELLAQRLEPFTGPDLFIWMLVEDSAEQIPIAPMFVGNFSGGGIPIHPGQSISILGNVFNSPQGFVFDKPGRHRLLVELSAIVKRDYTGIHAKSSPVEVEVTEPRSPDRDVFSLWNMVAKDLTSISDCGLSSTREGTRIQQMGVTAGSEGYLAKLAVFDQIRTEHPATLYGAYCLFFFAERYVAEDGPGLRVITRPLEQVLEYKGGFQLSYEVRLNLADRYSLSGKYREALELLEGLPFEAMDFRDANAASSLVDLCERALEK